MQECVPARLGPAPDNRQLSPAWRFWATPGVAYRSNAAPVRIRAPAIGAAARFSKSE
jgi:hypothetical protein